MPHIESCYLLFGGFFDLFCGGVSHFEKFWREREERREKREERREKREERKRSERKEEGGC